MTDNAAAETDISATGLSVGNVAIWVRDLDLAVDFYTRGLGLDLLATIEAGEVREAIVGRAGNGSQLMLAWRAGEPPAAPAGIWKVFLASSDARGDYKRALAAGAQPVAEPYVIEKYAVAIALVNDLDGYLVEFGQRLPR